ncbi:uncharacterized protein A4U43_C03F11410 [Asparagus officinalis]|uniref:Glycosyltransferase n=1 Tax=Asparagus officinalis TaxID=4686 RepID=A0A5P1F9Z0_ASPOF|nr:anthocyanidin 3-O-glucosyltransferase 2-like [Asparagus officinalis]ONK74914.1 uncharacterized protein A4U43_C03F11410 [Asparagus officinalis]
MVKIGVMFMPIQGVGHLISTVELAKLLLKNTEIHFSITILTINHLVPAWASAIKAYIDSVISLGLDITFEELPQIDPPNHQKPETFVTRFVDSHKPLVRDSISRYLSSPSSPPLSALVLDLFCTSMIDVANEFDIPAYIYFTSTAAMLSLMLYLPDYYSNDVEGDIDLPGLSSLPKLCVPEILRDKNDEDCNIFLHHGKRFREAKGIIVNTFDELEPASLKALVDGRCLPDHPTPSVFPVGPLLALEQKKDGSECHECIKWLDEQPLGSVVFLCFGSLGCFERPQVKKIAEGLERSGQRFLWALRSPSTDDIRLPTDSNLAEVLPEGFLERIKERGKVWPSWAPQIQILAHKSVGGFVTHCGWNSSLESIWFGVPMLGWPLYAEQHLNAFEMGRVLGVALELKLGDENEGFVSSEEVERGVRRLMGEDEEGVKVRTRVEEMKVASRKALQTGGSSDAALERFVMKLISEMPSK